MPYAKTDRFDIYYEARGAGRPLVFLHGAGGNHLSWWQQASAFESRYQVITLDFPGSGLSKLKSGGYDNAYWAEAILAVFDHAGIDQAFLVSQSDGSYGSLKLAVTQPARVAGLVVASGLAPVGGEIGELDAIGREQVAGLAVKDVLLTREFRGKQPTLSDLFFQIGGFNLVGPGKQVPFENSVLHSIRVDELRAAIDAGVRITFLQGGADVTAHPPAYDLLRESLPGVEVVHVPDAPYSDYWENPDRFTARLDEILESGPYAVHGGAAFLRATSAGA